MIQLEIRDSDNPTLQRIVDIPDKKRIEIQLNNDAAISFGRSLLKEHETLSDGKFWEIHKGHRFYVDTQDTDQSMKEIMNNFSLSGEYEPHTTQLLEEHVKPGNNCLDVGASIGYMSMIMARQTGPTGKVYAIEPTLNQVDYLKKNVHINGYDDIITVVSNAAWDKEETININGNSTGRDNVKGIPLDSIISEEIDFIKIDVDGSEPKALKGLEETIKRSTNLKMVIEYYPKYITRLGLNPQDVLDFLDKYFAYSRIEGDYTEEYWNYFCIKK